MACRVLVTRPEPGAMHTARRLAALGFEPILLPLSETRALSVSMDGLPESIAVVAITSANALRHAPQELVAALARLPCYTVGTKTAQAARAAGFLSVHEGPGDAQGLADTLAGAMAGELAGRTVVYLCGRVRLAGFEQELAAAGVGVFPIETYDTVTLEYDNDTIAERLGNCPVDRVLLYSAKAAAAMRTIAGRPELVHLFAGATFLCLSGRVAAALAFVGGERIHVSPLPNEEALLGLLPA